MEAQNLSARPTLRVIDGRLSEKARTDEAHIEYVAAIHEGLREANTVHKGIAAAAAANRQHIRHLAEALREVSVLTGGDAA